MRYFDNTFEQYSSKIKSIFIPIINNEEIGKKEKTNDDNSFFIGRKSLIDKLKSWLCKEDSRNGVFLVSGYRGMGKTSYVNKVLEDIHCDALLPNKKMFDNILNTFVYCLIFVFLNSIFILTLFENNLPFPNLILYIIGIIIFLSISFTALSVHRYGLNVNKDNRISIKLNLGREVLKEKDVLALIAKMLYRKYGEYKSNLYYIHPAYGLFCLIIKSFTCVTLIKFLYTIHSHVKAFAILKWIYSVKLYGMVNSEYIKFMLLLFFSLSMFPVVTFLISKVIEYLSNMFSVFKACPTSINRTLHVLNDRINASVSYENDTKIEYKNISFGKKGTKIYPLAGVREIEQELIAVFDEISRFKRNAPKFIIVLDELDKMDEVSESENNKEDIIPEYESVTSGFLGYSSSRNRKQNVLSLLGNMKFFTSTAQAKFVFISGRELYDASLTDVSDREFMISSIFDGIIYVDSFLSSDNNKKEISSMTEMYICRRLMPESFIVHKGCTHKQICKYKADSHFCRESCKYYEKFIDENFYSFKNYRDYLKMCYDEDNEKLKEAIIDKTIIMLYHFSIYLAHVSNGAPKKITTYFEKHVKTYSKDNNNILLIKSKKDNNCDNKLCLAFGYSEQQKINFIHYMSYPVIQAVINTSGKFGDKLLLSASFITDHIYKHHKDGFSWRNIELVPELLDANKTPELRSFINSIICFLKQTHLSAVYSGVYTMKFPKKISEEISYFSKLSEEVSAIFNFTLDETLSVKRYYLKLLNYYKNGDYDEKKSENDNVGSIDNKKKTDASISNNEPSISNNSILASIHHILGDLYMSEEDFSNAIFEYKKCACLLPVSKDNVTPYSFLYYIRDMLKLGMAYEKRKTYDSAYFIYEELASKLLGYRYFDENKYGLKYQNDIITRMIPDQKDSDVNCNLKDNRFNTINKEDMLTCLIEEHLPESGKVIGKLTLFEDVRFIYQVLLSKLLLAEKMEFGGITHAEMDVTVAEFNFLSRFINEKEKFAITANFYREMGDIMYYKNGFLEYKISNGEKEDTSKAWDLWSYRIEDTIRRYVKKQFENQQDSEQKQQNIEFLRKDLISFFKQISEKDLVDAIDKNNTNNILENEVYAKYLRERNGGKMNNHVSNIFNNYIFKDRDDSIIYGKICGCNHRRDDCEYNKNYYSCYACKFYNESLRILIKNVFETPTEDKRTKVLVLWNNLVTSKTIPREDTLILIASILNSFGNVLLSCSDEKDDISTDFLSKFFKAIELSQNKGIKTDRSDEENSVINIFDRYPKEKPMSFVEKSILYFWTAAEYYSTSNSKEASYCHKKIINLLLNYFKVEEFCNLSNHEQYSQENRDLLLKNTKKYIVNRSIRYLYSQYEKINVAEIQKLKWMFSTDMYQDIPLNVLSLFPDIEDLLYAYMELDLLLNKNNKSYYDKRFSNQYTNRLFTSFRIDSTVCEKILSLHLKAQYNKRVLLFLLKNNRMKSCDIEDNFSTYLAPCAFFSGLKNYLSENVSVYDILKVTGFSEQFISQNKQKTELVLKLELLQFLIHDSLFCFSKIIEGTSSNRDTTLFSQSFLAESYNELFYWNEIFEFLYDVFKVSQSEMKTGKNQSIKSAIIKDLYHFCKNRYFDDSINTSYTNINILIENIYENENDDLYYRFFVEIGAQHICDFLMDNLDKDQLNICMDLFEQEIQNNAVEARVNYLNTNYCAEMAINRYRSCEELHTEGKTYKEKISNIYLQNDDLNNDTCQFQYAIERYMINCGYIKRKMNILKKIFFNSNLYNVDKYIKSV